MNARGSCGLLIALFLLFTSVPVLAGSCDTALLIVDMQVDLLGLGAGRLVNVFSKPILGSVEAIVITEGHGDFLENLSQARARQYQWTRLTNVTVVKSANLDLHSLGTP